MPFFRFLIHGEGIRRQSGATGFYTVRHCRASDMAAAEAKALAALAEEWRPAASEDGVPCLSVVKKWPINIFQLRTAPNAGHTFYQDDPESRAAALELELEAAGFRTLAEARSAN